MGFLFFIKISVPVAAIVKSAMAVTIRVGFWGVCGLVGVCVVVGIGWMGVVVAVVGVVVGVGFMVD